MPIHHITTLQEFCLINAYFLWYIVDVAILIQKAEYSQHLLQHINSIDPHIQFTTESPNTDGLIPILDTVVSPGPDNSLLTTVYSKPTLTYQHFYWGSHHSPSAKYSVFHTFTHRARTVCANTHLLHKEDEHIKGTLQKGKYDILVHTQTQNQNQPQK